MADISNSAHHHRIMRHRYTIQCLEDILADDKRRLVLGWTREYLEEYRVATFCALINYQIQTFDRVSKFCQCRNQFERSHCAYEKGGYCNI